MARGKPKGLAVSAERWIGLRSPHDGGVAAAEGGGELPGVLGGEGGRFGRAPAVRRGVGAGVPRQIGGARGPDGTPGHARLGHHDGLGAAPVGLELLHVHDQFGPVVAAQFAVLGDGDRGVDQAHQREREGGRGHQAELEREAQQVRIGDGQDRLLVRDAVGGEAAQFGVRAEGLRVDLGAGQDEPGGGGAAPAEARLKSEVAPPLASSGRSAGGVARWVSAMVRPPAATGRRPGRPGR